MGVPALIVGPAIPRQTPALAQRSKTPQAAAEPTTSLISSTARGQAIYAVRLQLKFRQAALAEHRDLRANECITVGDIDLVKLIEAKTPPNQIIVILTRHLEVVAVQSAAPAPMERQAQQPYQHAAQSSHESVEKRADSQDITIEDHIFIENTPDDVWARYDIAAGDEEGFRGAVDAYIMETRTSH
jgi:hypothetical protein